MAKGFSKLAKFKSVLKKMQSFKLGRSSITEEAVITAASDEEEYSGDNLQTVYVGKSRRRYLISSDVTENPLFRELVRRIKPNHNNDGNENDDDDGDSITVGCEVVLFEHLLWMLENAGPQQESSLDELVDFYAC